MHASLIVVPFVGWIFLRHSVALLYRARLEDIVWHQNHRALLQTIDLHSPSGFASLVRLFEAPQFSNFRFHRFNIDWLESLIECSIPYPMLHSKFLNSDVLLLSGKFEHFFTFISSHQKYVGVIWPADVAKVVPFYRESVINNMLQNQLDYTTYWQSQSYPWLLDSRIWALIPLSAIPNIPSFVLHLAERIKARPFDELGTHLMVLKYWQIIVVNAINHKGRSDVLESLDFYKKSPWKRLEAFRASKSKSKSDFDGIVLSLSAIISPLKCKQEKSFWLFETVRVIVKFVPKKKLVPLLLPLLDQVDLDALPVNTLVQLLYSLQKRAISGIQTLDLKWKPLFYRLMHVTSRGKLPLEPFETRFYKFQIAHLAKIKATKKIVDGTVLTKSEFTKLLQKYDTMECSFLITGTVYFLCNGKLMAVTNFTELIYAYLHHLKSIGVISAYEAGVGRLIHNDSQEDYVLPIFRAVMWLLLVKGSWDDSINPLVVEYWWADSNAYRKRLRKKLLECYKARVSPESLLTVNVNLLRKFFRSSDKIFKPNSALGAS